MKAFRTLNLLWMVTKSEQERIEINSGEVSLIMFEKV